MPDHSAGGLSWRASLVSCQELAGFIGIPQRAGRYQVDFRFSVLDLSQLPDDQIEGVPILQSTLRLLKYSRSQQLVGMLGDLLLLVARSLPEKQLPDWIKAIGVYVMSVNKDIGARVQADAGEYFASSV